MKRLLLSLAVVFGLIAAIAAVRLQVSTDAAVRHMVAALMPTAHPPAVSIGSTRVRLFPRLAIEFGAVTIGTPSDRAHLKAERIVADLDVLPLIIGQTSISRLILLAPHLAIAAPFTLDGLMPERDMMARMRPASVIVRRGTITFRSDTGTSETFDGIEANLRWPRALANLSLDASATWRGEPVSLLLQGLSPPRLALGDTGDTDVTLRFLGFEASFTGKARLSDRLQLDGRLNVAVEDPRRVGQHLGLFTGNGRAGIPRLPDLALDGHLKTLGWTAALNDARLKVGRAAADGFLSAQFDLARPQVRGTLAFGTIDLALPKPTPGETSWLDWTPDVASLDDIDLDLRFSVTRAMIDQVRATNMAASLLVSNGQIHADVGDATIFDGSGSVILRGGVEKGELVTDGRFSLMNASIGALRTLLQLDALPQIGGLLTVNSGFQARGASLGALIASLTGNAHIDVAQASIESRSSPSLTLVLAGSQLARAVANQLVVSPAVTALRAGIRFAGSDLTIDDLAFRLGAAQARLVGRVSLALRTLALTGSMRMEPETTPALAPAANPEPPLPSAGLRINGTLSAATVTVRDNPPTQP